MADPLDAMRRLLDESSLGTPAATRLRARTDEATLRKIKARIAAGEAAEQDGKGQRIDREEEVRNQ